MNALDAVVWGICLLLGIVAAVPSLLVLWVMVFGVR